MDPKTLKYLPTHEWTRVDGDVATIGISKFAVEQLTDLLTVELPKVGSKVTPGKSFGVVESVKAVSDLYAPVAGEVVEVNAGVAQDVSALAEDPYGAGWLIKVRMSDPARDLAELLSYDDYERKVAESPH
jgi:glycine cleavage system H protein